MRDNPLMTPKKAFHLYYQKYRKGLRNSLGDRLIDQANRGFRNISGTMQSHGIIEEGIIIAIPQDVRTRYDLRNISDLIDSRAVNIEINYIVSSYLTSQQLLSIY